MTTDHTPRALTAYESIVGAPRTTQMFISGDCSGAPRRYQAVGHARTVAQRVRGDVVSNSSRGVLVRVPYNITEDARGFQVWLKRADGGGTVWLGERSTRPAACRAVNDHARYGWCG